VAFGRVSQRQLVRLGIVIVVEWEVGNISDGQLEGGSFGMLGMVSWEVVI